MIEKIKKNLFISIGAAALIYLALAIYADYDLLLKSFYEFNLIIIPILFVLTYSNYVTRFAKWHYYLNLLDVNISFSNSYSIFMSGLIMSVTPGKMGELLKSYMVKQVAGVSISKTAPIIIVERITDFLSLILLALIGALVYNYGIYIVIATGVFFVFVVMIISSRRFSLKIIDRISQIKIVSKFSGNIRSSYESSYEMLKPVPLIKMIILSLAAWFFECFAFYLILINFNIDVSILWATFAYAFATIAGSITMLPAGLGVTEGSLTFLILQKGASKNIAVAATFIIRIVTLWFAVFVGIVSLFFYQKKFGKKLKIERL